MESPRERVQRITRLEQDRARRRADMGTVWPTPDDTGVGVLPVEIAPGRGNLAYSSSWIPSFPTALEMIGHRPISFTRVFQTQPWVAAAVMRMLTWAIRVPLKVYERLGDAPNAQRELTPAEHPLAAALAHPWAGGSRSQLMQALLGPIMVHGNSVTQIESGAGDKIQFTGKDWRYCRPIMPWRDSVVGWQFDTDVPAIAQEVSADDVLHACYWSPTGPIGTSPLMQLGITLSVEDAAQRYQQALFRNGARPPGTVTMSDEFLGVDPLERQQIIANLREDVDFIYSGPENQGRPALLPPGLDWKEMDNGTAVEAALIEQRKLNREEVCGVYLIPPPMLGILDKATFSNIDTQKDMVYTDCLGPPLILLEDAINVQIVNEILGEDDSIFVSHDFSQVLRGDPLSQVQAIREAIATGILTPNEGRDETGKPRDPNPAMDKFYLPANNLQPIGSEEKPVVIPAGGQPVEPGGDGAPAKTVPAPPAPPPAQQQEEAPVNG